VAASGRSRSRFCIARPAEVEWLHPVATAHGSVLRALRRLSDRIRSLTARSSVTSGFFGNERFRFRLIANCTSTAS
jgi:hypothetical protein